MIKHTLSVPLVVAGLILCTSSQTVALDKAAVSKLLAAAPFRAPSAPLTQPVSNAAQDADLNAVLPIAPTDDAVTTPIQVTTPDAQTVATTQTVEQAAPLTAIPDATRDAVAASDAIGTVVAPAAPIPAPETQTAAETENPAPPAFARANLTALAFAQADRSALADHGAGARLTLGLSTAVPYRIFTLTAPDRMVIDFAEVNWSGFDLARLGQSAVIPSIRVGVFRPGWSRMVLELAAPMQVQSVQMQTGGAPILDLILQPQSREAYDAGAGTPVDAELVDPDRIAQTEPLREAGPDLISVVLDPGHGGIDPGAEHGGIQEKDLLLSFAKDLRDQLLRAGGFEVTLTRTEDMFVPLEARVSIARAARADVFVSLHADAVTEGQATGATVYTLSDKASDVASQMLAERHDRDDLLSGVDLSDQDDVIAGVLMDMARRETTPRTDALADLLVTHLGQAVKMHKRPRMEAGFSVLKAPDMPSVLIELGYMSSKSDLNALQDDAWRTRAASAIRDALIAWTEADRAQRALMRQ